MKHIALLLHFYQPPTQDPEVVKRINGECYAPVLQALADTGAPVTINMNFSLTEQLHSLVPETLEKLSRLKECAFTESGAYHPVFPIVPGKEVVRQLELNSIGNGKLIGKNYHPQGVFPPEMAVDHRTVKTLGELGYRWTITDDIPWVFSGREVPSSWIPGVNGTAVFLRSNFWSNRISFHGDNGSVMADTLVRDLHRWTGEDDSYLVVAMDGETFGHHRKNGVECFLRPFLEEIPTLKNAVLSTLDQLLETFPVREAEVPAGSWSTTFDDLKAGEPFPLWDHSANTNHRTYLELLNFVLENSRASRTEGVASAIDKMLYSCPLWWASPGRVSYAQVRRGILLILEAALDGIPGGELLDRVMELAGRIPAMAGRE